jgi:stage III sporulation protein AE
MKKRLVKVKFCFQKSLYVVFLVLSLLPLLCTKSFAEEVNSTDKINSEVDSAIEDFKEILPDKYKDMENIEGITDAVGIKRILEGVLNEINGHSGEITTFLLMLLGAVMIGALASVTTTEMGVVTSRAIGVVASAMLFERLLSVVLGAVASLGEVGDFFGAVIPVSLAVNTIGVSPTTATTQAVGMGVTLGVYGFVANTLVLPVVVAIFVTSAASSVDPLFARISKGVKDVFSWVIGIFTALVGATFSLQSVISSSADSAAIRSARYAITGTIPIVGNVVSGALGIVAGGVSYARSLVGGGAIAVIIMLVLSPLVTLLLYRICIRIGVFFATLCSVDGCASVLSSFLGAFDALIATYALTSIVYILEMVAFLKGGASIA